MEYINRKTGVTITVNSQLGGDWVLISAPPAVSIPEEPEQKPESQPEPIKAEKKKPAKKKAKTK